MGVDGEWADVGLDGFRRVVACGACRVVRSAAGFVAGEAAAGERRVALVIGNGAYAGAEGLDTPRQDAADVSAAFGKLGFTLIAYAAAPGETARDKHANWSKGLYSGELVQALAQEPEVENRELIRRVGARVNRLNSGQNPSSEEIRFYASLHLADPKVVADPRVEKGPGSNFPPISAIADPQSRRGRPPVVA